MIVSSPCAKSFVSTPLHLADEVRISAQRPKNPGVRVAEMFLSSANVSAILLFFKCKLHFSGGPQLNLRKYEVRQAETTSPAQAGPSSLIEFKNIREFKHLPENRWLKSAKIGAHWWKLAELGVPLARIG